jgi:hypothetical protein
VTTVDAFGPPGYGEHPEEDERVTYLMLRLSQPITVRGNPGSPFNETTETDATERQLAFEEPRLDLTPYVGVPAVLKG